jgi:DNA-binding transcriptional regulator GbsR (MarR family)
VRLEHAWILPDEPIFREGDARLRWINVLLLSIMLSAAPNPAVAWHRLRLADAWGSVAVGWGLPPAVARAHGYLVACGEPMTERQVREALGLSHRAASIALERTVELGLATHVQGRRLGARGPVGVAYQAVEDDWVWFGRAIAERRESASRPAAVAVREAALPIATDAAANPGDARLSALGARAARLQAALEGGDRAVAALAALAPRDLEALAGAARSDLGVLVRLARVIAGLSTAEQALFVQAAEGLAADRAEAAAHRAPAHEPAPRAAAEEGPTRPARAPKAEKPPKPAKAAKPPKPAKPEKPAKGHKRKDHPDRGA